ncbi:hypothetical protein ACP4OV_015113 [Aristida adscensionis]
MQLPSRLARAGFRGLSLFRSQCSNVVRSIHLAPRSGEPSDSPPAAADAKDPRSVLLNCHDIRSADGSAAGAGAMTAAAESLTSTGRRRRVWLGLAAPPASSHLWYDVDCAGAAARNKLRVVAAHRDAVLFCMWSKLPDDSPMAATQICFRLRQLPPLIQRPAVDQSRRDSGATSAGCPPTWIVMSVIR